MPLFNQAQQSGTAIPVQVSGTTHQMSPNTAYIIVSSSRCILTLPSKAAIGDIITIIGSSGGWKIAQNANQVIHGASDTTTGTNGYIQSQTVRDVVSLRCTAVNNEYTISGNRGTLDIV